MAPSPSFPCAASAEAVEHLLGQNTLAPIAPAALAGDFGESVPDLSEVRGQEMAKRALEVAAAGGHNLLYLGPPGSGKTMIARRLPGLLPPLTLSEAIAVTKIHSLVAEEPPRRLDLPPPVSQPAHRDQLGRH